MASDEELRQVQRDLAKISERLARTTGENEATLFKDFASKYLAEKLNKSSLRESTKKSFEHQTRKHLIPTFGHLPLSGTPWAVEFDKWVMKTRKENEGNADPHVRRFFNARKDLSEVLLAAFKAGHIEKQPKLDNPDERREVGRWVTRSEVARLIRKARRPFRVIFMAFFRMGCRPRELLKWEWSMLKTDEGGQMWIDVPARITKTDRARTIPVNSRLAYVLRIRQRHGNNSKFVFPSRMDLARPQLTYHSAWNEARIKAKIIRCVPYDLRRSIISTWAKEGVSISYAARLLDSSPKMLQEIYTRFDSALMKEIIK